MTRRECLWREIRESATFYEAPPHLSDEVLLSIAKKLDPLGPMWMESAEAFGMTQKEWIDRQADFSE